MIRDSLSATLRDWLHAPIQEQLGAIMADVKQVRADFQALKTDLTGKLDSIDGVIEALRAQVAQGQADQATVDQLASEVAGVRTSLASVNPEDPSGDDTPPAPAP